MPIQLTVTAPNGAICTHHKLLAFESNLDQAPDALMARFAAYGSEDNLRLGTAAYHWSPVRIPVELLDCQNFVPSIELVMAAAADSPLRGGVLIGPVTDLSTAKARRWAEIKLLRAAHEFGPLVWDGSTFDADAAAQSRIQGAAQLAALAIAAGEPLSRDWTLADNSVRAMSAEDLIALGRALAQQISGAHEIARGLRERIDAALTPEEAASVDWPPAETFFQA